LNIKLLINFILCIVISIELINS